ncbi:MAG: UvrD-helicase domain-containing protein [Lentisphaerae bacterium]|jgi:DNA helicase II / ATP-dependent DNA helicase PcrA|nr:UvrD-helicase domain-containing protein [Lentisphaerota bacterium]MBT4820138.1 UvrD-helicase domain-containing protein [Lentisphaerota bacterium]MBT5613186.1 UvrD-helicase domain-containing protein [Lentisphaerota bacterium]MBT7061855.1 UvrD-helicase domain-containing protein [Lentisphaerota bacterium]MBT7843681.1 UvrD-helicase domain-containing protein [Lentisphaerota bacterium]
MPSDLLDNLTETQLEAVTHIDGPMLVVAGAGSGKTRVVTRRIAYLISKGVWPNQILAMTFTNKAANEMKERVEQLVGVAPRWVGTFHSACAKFLRQDLEKLGDGRNGNFTIYDSSDQQSVVKACVKELEGTETSGRTNANSILSRISRAKCALVPPATFGKGTPEDDRVARVYKAYEKSLRQMNAVDFDDLLLLTVKLLEQRSDLRDIYHSRFRYLLIDEYQDTNRLQYRLMRLLTGPKHNVHVTGDPDQSIYSWRGADYRNIMDFAKDFENTRVVRLEQNYRSTKTILAASNALIQNNTKRFEKELFTDNDRGVQLTVKGADNERMEALHVAQGIVTLRTRRVPLSEMAIFYRTNAQSRSFEEVFMRVGVPYQIVGGVRFYERKEIKDILAHLTLLGNPRDVVALKRVVGCRSTGVGDKTLARLLARANEADIPVFDLLCSSDFKELLGGRIPRKLANFAAWCRDLAGVPRIPVGECVREVLGVVGLVDVYRNKSDTDPAAEDRIENLEAFVDRAFEFEAARPEATLADFLEDVALVADVDAWDSSADCLSLMTLHSSKGLEFPHVFVAGVEEGYLPHQNSEADWAVEEERRLLYVGITRAQKSVMLTYARQRYTWGRLEPRGPSRFLSELPPETVTYDGTEDDRNDSEDAKVDAATDDGELYYDYDDTW